MLTLCILLILPQAIVGFEWLSANSLPNGTAIPTCSGQDVTFGWRYQTAADEHLTNVEWHFYPRGGGDVVMATEVLGNFFAAPGSSLHLQYIPNAGIRLHNVNATDSGIYSVHVNLNLHGSVVVEEQAVELSVNDDPITTDGQLHVTMLPEAMYENTTKEFHIRLSCGNFKPIWGTRVSMLWKTPDGRTLQSTDYDNGKFYLNVPNPVESGEYTCLIDQATPATLCVPSDSPVQRGATVGLDGVKVQFALMEARMKAQQQKQDELEAQLAAQLSKNSALETRLTLLQATEEALVHENAHLKQLVEAAASTANTLQAKLATATKQVYFWATTTETRNLYTLGDTFRTLFNHEEVDVGGGYDPSTGYFTAPVTGLYLFTVTVDVAAQSGADTHVGVAIHVEGQSTTSEAWAGAASSGSTKVIAHLRQGQRAYVTPATRQELLQLGRANIGSLATGSASSFSGVLIQADV